MSLRLCAYELQGDDDVDAKRSRPSIGKLVKGHAILERALLVGTRSADHIRASSHSGCIATGQASTRKTGRIHGCTDDLQIGQIPLAPRAVAVGTEIALCPPHRSRRALLTHRAPTLDGDEEPLFGPRVQDAWEWQVPVSDLLHSRPRKSTSLASTHQRAVPTFDHVMPEC